jgi:hypothetical protein
MAYMCTSKYLYLTRKNDINNKHSTTNSTTTNTITTIITTKTTTGEIQ